MCHEVNSEIKASIIVPVWNPGPGVSRCIDSLRNQTLKEIEIIFVDDCGTDDSMDIIRASAEKDPRITIIENDENIGSGLSRNKGIAAARGEYLSFIDPDDYIAPDFLDLLYAEARKEHFDIVKGSVVRQREDGTVQVDDRKQNLRIINGLAQKKPLYSLFTFEHQSAIYRREFLLEKKAFYGTSSRDQDTTFLLKACSQAESFSLADKAYYYFCERFDSAMHIMDESKLQGSLQALREQVQFLTLAFPDNHGAHLHARRLFINALREYSKYDYVKGMEESAKRYLDGLREELMKLPFCEDIIKDSFPLQVLCEHRVGLPSLPYYAPWEGTNPPIRYAELVKRWVDYYVDHPVDSESVRKNFVPLYNRAKLAAQGKPSTTYSADELAKGRELLQKQIKRLSPSLQMQIFILSNPIFKSALKIRKAILNRIRRSA